MPKPGFKSLTLSEAVYDKFNQTYQKNKGELTLKGVNSFSGYVTYLLEDVMKKDNLQICSLDTTTKELIHIITQGKCGLVAVMSDNTICGIITDGDIRRVMETKEEEFFKLQAGQIMSKNPKKIDQNTMLFTCY